MRDSLVKLIQIILNTHNYNDMYHLDQTQRITQISNIQKQMTAKYHACMIATAEYRKNSPKDISKMILPVDDDLADARALMFRPNVIFHVYNDLHDRKDYADIFHTDDDGNRLPRLLLDFSKNKISKFKDKLVLDLDPNSVTLSQIDPKAASREAARIAKLKEEGKYRPSFKSVSMDAEEYEEDDDL